MTGDPAGHPYVIRVRGHVDMVWAARFPGFTVTHDAGGTTTFSGTVVDQAGLYGLISRFRDSGLALISIEPAEWSDTGDAR